MDEKPQCCSVESGSFVYGIFASIVAALGVLFTTGLLLLLFVVWAFERPYWIANYVNNEDLLQFGLITISVLLLFILEFALCVALTDGANKRKSGHVKAYYIYGVVKNIISAVTAVILLCLPEEKIYGATVLGITAVYALVLLMVYKTYRKFALENPYKNIAIESVVPNDFKTKY